MTEEPMKCFLRINSKVLENLEKRPTYFGRPRLVGLYDIEYDKCTPAKKIRYHFKKPRLSDYPFDLNEGKETFQFLKHGTETNLIRPLFHAISISFGMPAAGDNTINGDGDVEHTDVYTRRGVMENIMEFCYSRHDFHALISRFEGKIYMIRLELPKEEFDRQHVGGSHHRRLAQLLFVDTARKGSTPHDKPANDDNVFQAAVHQSTLGKYNFRYLGRAQGIDASRKSKNSGDSNDLNKQHYVSTKQMWSSIKNRNQKLLRYWLQAYLSNVSDLYIAYKDENAIVREPIERMRVCDIPKKCYWKPGICTTFLSDFLEKVELLMSSVNSLDTVYKFHFNAKDKTIYYKLYEGKTELSFIPKEYANILK